MSIEQKHIQPGTIVGPYRIVRGFKGRGGMAGVFEAQVREKYRQPDIPRRLAIKVAGERHQAALIAEADFLRRFDHPNVVRIFPLPRGEDHRRVYAARERFPFGWGWYYAMEMINGGSMEQHLTRPTTITDMLRQPTRGSRHLSTLLAVGISRQLASALEHIHAQSVINLDVKPGNVLFHRQRFQYLRGSVPQAVLCDFGISRDLRYPRAGLLGVATPEYVSPEQLSETTGNPLPVDGRSDVFSLGVMLYEMLTGQLPFANTMVTYDLTYTPTPPSQIRSSIPASLDEIVMKALSKDMAFRFQTATEMRVALEQVRVPLDWKKGVRRTFAGATTLACILTGGWGIKQVTNTTPTTTPVVARTSTRAPALAPDAVTPSISPTPTIQPSKTRRAASTSTPAPTLTPTNTYVPRTLTPTSEGE